MNAGFWIDGVLYEWADGIRLRDAPLVREITGLEFEDFAERVDKKANDLLVVIGLMGIAVAQARPDLPRSKVCDLVGNQDMTQLEIEDGEPDPPAGGAVAPESPSLATSSESTTIPEDSSTEAPV